MGTSGSRYGLTPAGLPHCPHQSWGGRLGCSRGRMSQCSAIRVCSGPMSTLGTTATTERRTPRATPLAPAARRAAIVEATLPLLRAHGLSITTRQIAEAAGVAEGTIFGVFPDKDALLQAVMEAAFDPEPVRAQLGTNP